MVHGTMKVKQRWRKY